MTFCGFAGSIDNGNHSGSRSLWRDRATYKRESHPVCRGLVLYFSFTSLLIVLGLFLQPCIAVFSYFSIDTSTAEREAQRRLYPPTGAPCSMIFYIVTISRSADLVKFPACGTCCISWIGIPYCIGSPMDINSASAAKSSDLISWTRP